MQNLTLTLTDAALEHFSRLILLEDHGQELNLRVSVTDPGTLKADVGLTFCELGDQEPTDFLIEYPKFKLFVAQDSIQALTGAVIDYVANEFGGQLSVKAPLIRGSAPAKDSPLAQRVQYIIDTEINPGLASHGGIVSLESIVDNGVVVLRFGGGCHGCGMADVTLKNGIEKTLLAQCPEITAVVDATDHATGKNPYYV